MSKRLSARLAHCKANKKTAFVSFVTCGFPTMDHTEAILFSMEKNGADVIEVGVPFTDPQADGNTIQRSSVIALKNGASVAGCLKVLKSARDNGLKVPIILMGYLNPMLAYGFTKLAKDSKAAGADGFIIVDLPAEAGFDIIKDLNDNELSFVPLVTRATREDRIARLAALATGFVYCVALNGVTGARSSVPTELPGFIKKVRSHTDLPIMVGFGISEREHVQQIGEFADGVVVGSAFVLAAESAGENADATACALKVGELVNKLTGGNVLAESTSDDAETPRLLADLSGFENTTKEQMFGEFGGRYIPELLVAAHEDLWEQWKKTKDDPDYIKELARLRKDYVGGPTPIFECKNLTAKMGGAHIWLKREDLAHTGAHKINNALGQALLAVKLGKKRIIAETGAGQHGVATATACALLGLDCTIYMGAEDCRRQSLNVFKMNILGAKCIPVENGSKTLKDAINEAMRDWVANVADTHYIVGSAIGPHPFPTIVRDLQSVIGLEAREQFQAETGQLPDVIMACVGGGSNAIGLFHPFKDDASVKMIGVEAGGEKGVEGGPGTHSATLSHGTPGVLHGTRTYILQDEDGQVTNTHSISAGLDYPGVGPEHAHYKFTGRAEYVAVNNAEALSAFQTVSQSEGIIPALECSHVIAHGMNLAKTMAKDKHILINLSGRGDKDMVHVANILGVKLGV